MKRNEIEAKKKTLEFHTNYIEISKIALLQKLNVEINNLNIIRSLKRTNHNLLNQIGTKWLSKYNNFYETKKSHLPKLYILIDPEKYNDYTKVALAKLDDWAKVITFDDHVITVGHRVSKIALRNELLIIENMLYREFQDTGYFAEKLSSLIETGLTNNIFGEVHLVFAENNLETQDLIRYKLFPFDKSQLEERAEAFDIDGAPLSKVTVQQVWVSDYKKILDAIDLKKTKWYPNISYFYNLFSKSIIKGQIFEGEQERKIQKLRLQLAILDEKKKKLDEKTVELKRLWNRIRKEEATNASLILYAAFKTKQKNEATLPDYTSALARFLKAGGSF